MRFTSHSFIFKLKTDVKTILEDNRQGNINKKYEGLKDSYSIWKSNFWPYFHSISPKMGTFHLIDRGQHSSHLVLMIRNGKSKNLPWTRVLQGFLYAFVEWQSLNSFVKSCSLLKSFANSLLLSCFKMWYFCFENLLERVCTLIAVGKCWPQLISKWKVPIVRETL